MKGQQPSSRRFAFCYVLAMFGAFMAFIPLTILILPQKIAMMPSLADQGGAVRALSWLLVAGGMMAGCGNIVAGVASDRLYRRHGSRRGLIVLGLVFVVAALAGVGTAQSFDGLLLAMLAFQLALNLLLAPLVTLIVDYVPDRCKGAVAGWTGLALPVGSLMVTLLSSVQRIGPVGELAITCLVVVALVAPLALLWPVPKQGGFAKPGHAAIGRSLRQAATRNFVLAWVTRLLVQFAAAAILPYLYYFVADVARPADTAAEVTRAVGMLAFAFAIASVAGGLFIGWVSDNLAQRRLLLTATAIAVALGMVLLASTGAWWLTLMAYALFAAGLAGFLTVNNALVAELVSSSAHRATLLGLMNLSNTLPAILAPIATLLAIGDGVGGVAMETVLRLAAVCAGLAALCSSQIRMP